MSDIKKDKTLGTIIINDSFDPLGATGSVTTSPNFEILGDEWIISFIELEDVIKFNTFKYNAEGLNDVRYLLPFYRVSRDGNKWTDWLDLKNDIDNFPDIDPNDKLFLDIKFRRVGTSNSDNIKLLDYELNGEIQRPIEVGTVTIGAGETKIIRAPYIFKIYKLENIEIISKDDTYDIEWRFSQDSTRTWSDWEPFTKENAITQRINPIRFFQVEYKVTNTGSSNITIQDINLIGDFQNLSNDAQRTNLFGIRECCKSNLFGAYDEDGNFMPAENWNLDHKEGTGISEMSDENRANLYNPYAQSTATKLLEKLSADSEQIFGHKVQYFVTDADKNGQDHTLHEYQLYNVVCDGELKISIDGNNFPDNQIKMNVFDLDLFDSMEAHITKKQFKQIFGVQRRPSKEDFMYFCDVNRMFQVDHAQQLRNFNNQAVYYKLILKKYNQKSNVKADTIDIKNKLDKLTNNSTVNQLFETEKQQDKAATANKQQHDPLTRDTIRLEYFADINKELIENSTTIISKAHYDLSSVSFRRPAVVYKDLDPHLRVSDNIGYQVWFRINNYINDEIYNFFHFYNEDKDIGMKTELSNDVITVSLNDNEYKFEIGTPGEAMALYEDTWYCYVLNIDQRKRNIEQFIYKRNVEDEDDAATLVSNKLKKVYENKQDIEPVEYLIENVNPQILSSDMDITNIRYFIDVIPEKEHNKILNQYIIGDDSKYLIFADNATTRLYLNRFPYNE